MNKWLLAALYAAALTFAFIYRNEIVDYMHQHGSFPVLVGLATLVALFPIIPYKLVIAALGYSFGTFWAAAISWLGTMIAATVIYALVRFVFREQGRRYLGRFKALQSFTSWVESRPFVSVAAGRLIPVIPQMAVNVFAGVASIPFWTYTAASGIGKLPGIFLYAFLGGQGERHPVISILVVAGYVILLGFLLFLYRKRGPSRPNSRFLGSGMRIDYNEKEK
ncbi:TVP38/TMEM64 family protein [Paenibacillus sp. HJL G12]|uniref:TVP38/TMEM64 family membrane protein n=1 Tax=Paenibacillus dendrobii TaxID=2691084 RepID=A0A7X3LHF7_9BACL|nr:TVP38/TMEM64 family protein [Paenibacillus dendrobii]MWV45097.1 TVP38/TMEM64 family protein [Paenibacillus dendrobii]